MTAGLDQRSKCAVALLIALVIAIGVFGVPVRYPAPVAIVLTLGQLLFIGVAAFSLIIAAWRIGPDYNRRVALIGMLLIMPWVFLTMMPGYGPPFAANLAMNPFRYIILFVSSAFLGAGFLLLKEPLADGGDVLMAPLGQASGLLGTIIQLVWAAILIGWSMSEAHKPAAYLPLYGTPLGNTSDVLLFFSGLFTYVATAFYALSFARVRWLGWRKGMVMATAAIIAVICLLLRGLQYPDLSSDWYMNPGMVVGIPAIPWLMPYILGVSALIRAAETD